MIPQIEELDIFRLQCHCEDQTFVVKVADGFDPVKVVKDARADLRSQVPKANGVVQGGADEGVVGGGHFQAQHASEIKPFWGC